MMTFALLGLIAFLGISLVPVYILRRREYARAQEYFVASEHTPPVSVTRKKFHCLFATDCDLRPVFLVGVPLAISGPPSFSRRCLV